MSDALRKLIRELVEQELEEVSTSGNAGPYNTPYAFRGNSAAGKEKAKKNATQSGYEMVDKKQDKADDAGEQSVETVPFGEKGAGALKKPKDEPKAKIEEATYVVTFKPKSGNAPFTMDVTAASSSEAVKKARELRSKGTLKTPNWSGDGPINVTAKLKEEVVQENRYTEYKMSEGTPAQKIGKAIREINRQISEVDRMLRMNERLKKESGVAGDQLWKSTARGLAKLESRLNTISTRIRNLKA